MLASVSAPGSSPTRSTIGSGRWSGGGTPSASPSADAQTSPPDGKHLERPRSLTDEVRGRLEPASPPHPAGGEQSDPVLAEVPARSLGDVARLGVVGKHTREGPAAGLLESGEEEGQKRFRHPSGSRISQEREQPLALRELASERGERR